MLVLTKTKQNKTHIQKKPQKNRIEMEHENLKIVQEAKTETEN